MAVRGVEHCDNGVIFRLCFSSSHLGRHGDSLPAENASSPIGSVESGYWSSETGRERVNGDMAEGWRRNVFISTYNLSRNWWWRQIANSVHIHSVLVLWIAHFSLLPDPRLWSWSNFRRIWFPFVTLVRERRRSLGFGMNSQVDDDVAYKYQWPFPYDNDILFPMAHQKTPAWCLDRADGVGGRGVRKVEDNHLSNSL